MRTGAAWPADVCQRLVQVVGLLLLARQTLPAPRAQTVQVGHHAIAHLVRGALGALAAGQALQGRVHLDRLAAAQLTGTETKSKFLLKNYV
jgi:hypothetical protein